MTTEFPYRMAENDDRRENGNEEEELRRRHRRAGRSRELSVDSSKSL